RWGQILGTGCGTVEGRSYRFEATKKAICWPFVKPSDGLEPSTPSLPWKFGSVTRVHARSLASAFVLQIQRSALAAVPASARTCSGSCTRLVPAARCLFSQQATTAPDHHR